jgi:hypothetical protein
MRLNGGAAEAPAAAANRMRIVRIFPKLLIERKKLRIPKTGLLLRIYKNSLHCARGCMRAEHGSGGELNCQTCFASFCV